jgi:hypothetical protein
MPRFVAFVMMFPVLIMPFVGRAQSAASQISDHSAPDDADRSRAIGCLTTAIAYEAGFEPVEGQQAVAEVIMNRVYHPAFPKSVCGVVFAGSDRRTGCQFSFTCDGSLRRQMSAAILAKANAVATAALDGQNPVRAAGATHYHADYVSPYWAPSLIRITKIGAHIFYRGAGGGDQQLMGKQYSPSSEPFISGAQNNIATVLPPAKAPAPNTLPAPPPVFAPWGLPPPQPTAN